MARFFSLPILTIFLIVTIIFKFDIAVGFVCPEEEIANGCKSSKECVYADPSNCKGFIQCTDGGEVFHQPCNVGLEWNDILKDCVFPKHSTCRSRD